jgi:tetratricopeptide (TPR) repeat protein
MRGVVPFAVVMAMAILSTDARAQPAQPSQASEESSAVEVPSEFWQGVADPGARRASALLQQALRMVDRAQVGDFLRGRAERTANLRGALRRLQIAERLAPHDAGVLFMHARVTTMLAGEDPSLADDALARWARLRAIDPTFEAEAVAFELGILHTRAQRFEEAAEEYERAIELQLTPRSSEQAIVVANLAEVTMLAGHLERALYHYERAHELARMPRQYALSLWGMAVCLDRLGEHQHALERAQAALSSEGGIEVLRDADVFFEPAFEVHWYEGLGHEAQAQVDPDQREQHLRDARASFRRFLSEGGANESPWAAIAEARVQDLDARLGSTSPAGRRRPPSRTR